MSADKQQLITCECGLTEHQFVLTLWDWGDNVEVFMEPHLSTYRNFFERVWAAIRYVFGYRCKYGEFDCVSLERKQLIQIVDFVEDALAYMEQKGEESES